MPPRSCDGLTCLEVEQEPVLNDLKRYQRRFWGFGYDRVIQASAN